MIGLDTNVLVRYITQDDPIQTAKANDIIDELTIENPAFITLISMVELTWVLESSYKLKAYEIHDVLDLIFSTNEFVIEQSSIAHLALHVVKENRKLDYSDALIAVLTESSGGEICYTFDKKAVDVGMTLIR